MNIEQDVMVVGGGIVGLAFACALAKQTSLRIRVFESKPFTFTLPQQGLANRVSAISLASQRMLRALGIWPLMDQTRIMPFKTMKIWHARDETALIFDSHEIAEPTLGYIIENAHLHSILYDCVKSYSNIQLLSPVRLASYQTIGSEVRLTDEDGHAYSGQVAIAADGANSWLRDQVGFYVHHQTYRQKAIVANVKTAVPHEGTARQIFLSTGSLAFLPLVAPHWSSIVWTLPEQHAEEKLRLTAEEFNKDLGQSFGRDLGEIQQCERRIRISLQCQWLSQYVKSRVVLMGDAAHHVHPLAGQGLNLGLLDAASLAELMVDAMSHQKPFANQRVLRAYERWRKADNLPMQHLIDSINRATTQTDTLSNSLMRLSINMTTHLPLLKSFFIRRASGARAKLPALANNAL